MNAWLKSCCCYCCWRCLPFLSFQQQWKTEEIIRRHFCIHNKYNVSTLYILIYIFKFVWLSAITIPKFSKISGSIWIFLFYGAHSHNYRCNGKFVELIFFRLVLLPLSISSHNSRSGEKGRSLSILLNFEMITAFSHHSVVVCVYDSLILLCFAFCFYNFLRCDFIRRCFWLFFFFYTRVCGFFQFFFSLYL